MKRALLIGINKYPGAPLRGCVNDVKRLAEHLKKDRDFQESDVRLLLDGRATKKQVLRELAWLTDGASAGDVLVLQFSGHGVQMPTHTAGEDDHLDECLCPVDFDWTDETTIRDDELRAAFSALPSGVRCTWVIDSCHSGTLLRASAVRDSTARTIAPPEDVASRVRAIESRGARRRSLQDRARKLGVAVASACEASQTAADASFDEGPHGAFTYYFLRSLAENASATLEASVASTKQALQAAHFEQRPTIEGRSEIRAASFCATSANGSERDQVEDSQQSLSLLLRSLAATPTEISSNTIDAVTRQLRAMTSTANTETVSARTIDALIARAKQPATARAGGREVVLSNGDEDVFPTWSWWGTTTVRLENVGAHATTAILRVNAAIETHFLNPGEGKTVRRQWGGFQLVVTNSSEASGAMLKVRVW